MNLERNTDTKRTQISVLGRSMCRFPWIESEESTGERQNYVTNTDRSADTARRQRGQYDATEPSALGYPPSQYECVRSVGWLPSAIADVLAREDVLQYGTYGVEVANAPNRVSRINESIESSHDPVDFRQGHFLCRKSS